MRAQIIFTLHVAVVCNKAFGTVLSNGGSKAGANYAGSKLNYASSHLLTSYSGLTAAGMPGAMKVYIVPSSSILGNYMIVSDVTGAVPAATGYGVVDPICGGTDAVYRYVPAPIRYAVAFTLGTSANITTYVVNK